MPHSPDPRGRSRSSRQSPHRILLFGLVALHFGLGPAIGLADERQSLRRGPSDFRERAQIASESQLMVGEAYGVPLSRKAVATFRRSRELRVFDARGQEIPSLVHTAHERKQLEKRPVAIYNAAWEPGLVQTLSVEIEDRTLREVNEFQFEIEDEQFNATVQVEGSQDGQHWRIVRQNLHLIRHALPLEKIAYVHDVLRISTSRFRYYRFTLTAPDRDEPFTIRTLSVRKRVSRSASLAVPVTLEAWNNPRDPDTRHDYWKLDLGLPDLGVDRVVLRIDGQEFARSASLWEWNEELGRPGARLATTVVFHYGNDRQGEFGGFSSDAQVLVAMIDQGDDEPVSVPAASASRPQQELRLLAVEPIAPPLWIYFLPDVPRTPKYDLERRLRERNITRYRQLSHAALTENPDYAEAIRPLSERLPYLLYVLVTALVAGLAAYIAHTVRSGIREEPPPN